jgi:hypothetical protein
MTEETPYELENGSAHGKQAENMRLGHWKKLQIELGLQVGKTLTSDTHIPRDKRFALQTLMNGELVETYCTSIWLPGDVDPEKVTKDWQAAGCCPYCLSLRFGKPAATFMGTAQPSALTEDVWQLRWYNTETKEVL